MKLILLFVCAGRKEADSVKPDVTVTDVYVISISELALVLHGNI